MLRDQLASIKQDTDKIKATPIVLAPVVEKTYGYLGVQISAKVKAGYQTPMKTMILDRCLRTLAQEQIKIQN